jgi:hypothetical protein
LNREGAKGAKEEKKEGRRKKVLIQYFGQFLIAYGRIRVSRLQGKFATNGKSMVSEYELKTVRTIVIARCPMPNA